MEVLVVGAGAMGRVLASYLSHRKSVRVSVYDIDRSKSMMLSREIGGRALEELDDLEEYDMALLCVPISSIPRMVDLLADKMREGSTVVEISSVKSPVMDAMRRAARIGLRPISLHPLFGPGIKDLSKGKAAIVEVTDLEKEVGLASEIFPFELIPVDVEEHDRAMAWLALTHLILNAFLSSSDGDAELLTSLSTTTLGHFIRLAAASLTQNEVLTRELMELNPYFPSVLHTFVERLSKRDVSEIRAEIRRWLELIDLREAYSSLYE